VKFIRKIRRILFILIMAPALVNAFHELPGQSVPPDSTAEPDSSKDSGKFKPYLQIRGRGQARFECTGEERSFYVPRARLALALEPIKNLLFEVESDYAGDNPRLLDLYVNYKMADYLRIFAGLSKKPLSAEENISCFDLSFIRRSRTNDEFGDIYSIGRDIGLMLYGDLEEWLPVKYWFGVFNGSDYERLGDDNRGKQILLRLEPRIPKRLKVGLNYSRHTAAQTDRRHDYFGLDWTWKRPKYLISAEYQQGRNDKYNVARGAFVWADVKLFKKIWAGARYEYFDKNAAKTGAEQQYTGWLYYEGRKKRKIRINVVYDEPLKGEPYWSIASQFQVELKHKLSLE